jgi:hypothetical protein
MKKDLHAPSPLDEAVKSLEEAIETLDEIIKISQQSQDILKDLTKKQTIGWVENGE